MLSVSHLSKAYGSGASAFVAIRDLTFGVGEGEFVCVVGPSGAGKTTLLRCLSGLIPATGGELVLAGRPIDGPPRDMAVVFQDYSRSLLPWFSVRRNVEFPLRGGKVAKDEIRERVESSLAAVGLSAFHDRLPWQLSGGMQQRVAIARALAYRPRVLLMDEPFASVDAQTRADLEDLTLSVRRQFGVTVLFVTHDIDEAVYLGDRVIVLSASPATVRDIVDVSLPDDRNQIETKEMADFARLRSIVLREVRKPVPPSRPSSTVVTAAAS